MNDKLAREQVERIVADPLFGSSRISRFLRYIVEETLSGGGDRLKAYSIALSVFDREPTFDPQRDSIVRVQAKRLRMQLELYYSTSGRNDPVLIRIPKGSYVPKFDFRSDADIRALQSGGTKAVFDRPASGVPVVALHPCSKFYSNDWHGVFCHGLMEELTDAFSKFRDIAVIPIGTTIPKLNAVENPIEYGRIFGADFVLETGIRGNSETARLSVKIYDTRTGLYAGTKSYDITHNESGMIALQEKIACELASLTAPPFGLFHADQLKLLGSGKAQARTAYEHLLVADTYYLNPSQSTFDRARAATTRATELAPEYAIANAMLAILYIDGFLAGFDGLKSDDSMLDDGYRIATQALRRFPDSGEAGLAVSMALFARGRYEEACTRGQQAINLNPNNKLMKSDYWFYRATSGDWQEAICEMDKLGQSSAENLRHTEKIKAINAYRISEFEAALDLFMQAYSPQDPMANLHIIMCLGQLNRTRQASSKIKQLKSLRPDLSLNRVARLLSRNYQPALTRHCVDGLRQAGFDQDPLIVRSLEPSEGRLSRPRKLHSA